MTAGSRTISWEDPKQIAVQAAGMPGLEFLRAVMTGAIPAPPISALFGFKFSRVEPGEIDLLLPIGTHFYNPIGVVHGGVAATVLDTVMGCAVHSLLPKGRAYSSLEIKINFLRPLTDALTEVKAEGRVINLGRKAGFAEGKIIDDSSKIYATGSTTCAVWDA